MIMMKYAGIFIGVLIFLVITSFDHGSPVSASDKTRNCDGTISILGSTNVNSFELKNSMAHITINACKHSKDSIALKTKKFTLQIPVRNFKTDNAQIYKDFLSLTKSSQHPTIQVGIGLSNLHNLLSRPRSISFPVEITIAGVTKSYVVSCLVSTRSDGCLSVTGSQKMKLTDFNMTPPAKMLGLVKVNNEIIVNFGFVITIA
jgi:hypothetical protein